MGRITIKKITYLLTFWECCSIFANDSTKKSHYEKVYFSESFSGNIEKTCGCRENIEYSEQGNGDVIRYDM